MTVPTGASRFAGVVGDPIAHSLSPRLMTLWIETLHLDAQYAPFRVKPVGFEAFARGLSQSQAAGLNVTLPHKETALAIADTRTRAAAAIGAANLLTFIDGKIHADNTDATGFLAALKPARIPYKQSTALILGAGGAARALVYALLTSGISRLILTNRSRERAEHLRSELAPMAAVIDWDQRDSVLESTDLIVNATSLGLNGSSQLALDWSRTKAGAVAFDSIYTPLDTAFMTGARAAGLRTVDGLDMLIGQARPSFEAFYNVPAPADLDVRTPLLAALGATS